MTCDAYVIGRSPGRGSSSTTARVVPGVDPTTLVLPVLTTGEWTKVRPAVEQFHEPPLLRIVANLVGLFPVRPVVVVSDVPVPRSISGSRSGVGAVSPRVPLVASVRVDLDRVPSCRVVEVSCRRGPCGLNLGS